MPSLTAKTLILMCLPALMTGCAMQTYAPKPIVPAQSVAQLQQRTLESAELRAYMLSQEYPESSFPIKTWGMRELTLVAFYYHPQLDVARAQWQLAQAGKVSAGQKPNPGISSGAEHHSKANGVSPWTLSFSLGFPIETGDKRAIRMARADSLSEAARIDIGQTAWLIRSRLRKLFDDYAATTRQAHLLAREVTLRNEIVLMLQHRLDAGMVSDIELTNVRLQLQKAQQALAVEQGKLPGIKAAIADAIGLPAQAIESVQLDTATTALAALPDAALQQTALTNRLDIRAALLRYDAAESRLKLEIAKQYPDITLSPGYSFDQGDNRWSLGLSTVLTLLNKNEGAIAEASAQRELEAQQFNALQSRVIGELDQSRTRYQAALDEAAKADQLLNAQQQRAAKTERQFEAGYADRLEQAGSQLETLGAEQGVLAASIRAQQALSMLEDAAQRPLDDSPFPTAPERKDVKE